MKWCIPVNDIITSRHVAGVRGEEKQSLTGNLLRLKNIENENFFGGRNYDAKSSDLCEATKGDILLLVLQDPLVHILGLISVHYKHSLRQIKVCGK